MTALPPYCSKNCVGALQVVAIQQPMRTARWSVAVKTLGPIDPADGVVDGVAGERRGRQQAKRGGRTQRAGRGQRAGREQQRVARQKRRHDESGLREDDEEEERVDPGAVGGHEVEQMAVAVKDEIDEGRHAADIVSHAQRLRPAVSALTQSRYASLPSATAMTRNSGSS